MEFSGRPELKLCHIWVEHVNVFFIFVFRVKPLDVYICCGFRSRTTCERSRQSASFFICMKLDTNIHCDSVSRGKSNVKLWKSLIAIFINQCQCLYYELVLFVCLFLNGPSLTECVSIQTVNPHEMQ